MSSSSAFVQLVIALPARDYAVYLAAVRRLVRLMGKQAPEVLALIVHTLRCRDARGLAEDYLESVNWPVAASGVPAQAGRSSKIYSSGKRGGRLTLLRPPADPARN